MKKPFFVLALISIALSTGVSCWAGDPTGVLEVSSDPAGAKVYINDIFVGRTPYRNEEIPLGSHRVRAVLGQELPSATWEGVIDGVGPEKIRFYFEKTRAVETPAVEMEAPAAPASASPPAIAVPSIDTGTVVVAEPVGIPEGTGPWGRLEITVVLTGDPPAVKADQCHLGVGVRLDVPLASLDNGDFFVGDFSLRPERPRFAYNKPDQVLLHLWDESCYAIEYRSASLSTSIRPGEYELKLSRRVKTRNLKFGVVPDDEMIYRLSDRETVIVDASRTTSIEVGIDLLDGSFELKQQKP